jgi:hypothetical protein
MKGNPKHRIEAIVDALIESDRMESTARYLTSGRRFSLQTNGSATIPTSATPPTMRVLQIARSKPSVNHPYTGTSSSCAPHQGARLFSRPFVVGGIMNRNSVPNGVAGVAQSFPP